MSKKTVYFLIGGAILIIAVLVGLSKAGVIGNKDEGKEVEISKVVASTIVETVSATGKIQPEIEVKLSSMVSGEIIALNVKEGQVVKKGDLLVKINPDLYTSGLDRSVANLSGTKASCHNLKPTLKKQKQVTSVIKLYMKKG